MLAAQDFRRATQRDGEPIASYIRRVEQVFRAAYGKAGMSSETRDTLLFNQMQEGLCYELMESPKVLGPKSSRSCTPVFTRPPPTVQTKCGK